MLTTAHAKLLKDSTSSVFGDIDKNIFPMAFLDFNEDKLMDILVISNQSQALSVLLARTKSLFPSGPAFVIQDLSCKLPESDRSIVSLIPGDFDGDGLVDVVAVTEKRNKFRTHVLWGDQEHPGSLPTLDCSDLKNDGIRMSIQPILLDVNGDYVSDLFGVDENNKYGFWIFERESRSDPTFVPLKKGAEETEDFDSSKGLLHSNSFIDLNEDGNADLFVTRKTHFEIWKNIGGENNSTESNITTVNFRHVKNVQISDCQAGSCAEGQVTFADFDKDGKMDLLFPVCLDGNVCDDPAIYFESVKSMFFHENFKFKRAKFRAEKWKFDIRSPYGGKNPYEALTARAGDLNLDGYPDLLIRMKSTENEEVMTTHFFMNVPSSVIDNSSSISRGFYLNHDVFENSENLVLATFYDANEDGHLDVLAVQDSKTNNYSVHSFSNVTLEGVGAFFMKIRILSGFLKSASDEHARIPHSVNVNGQTICYSAEEDPDANSNYGYDSCSAQIPQTAHAVLQSPETHFGVLSSVSSVETVKVRVTNGTANSTSRHWFQVILNAKLFIVPHPADHPELWNMKIFIPMGTVLQAMIAWVGVMIIIALVIGVLHFQDQRLDRREKLQERTQFRFSAM